VRSIVHLSDIHFGRVNPHVIPPLIDAITTLAPDLVAVSGDLTQRARPQQFRDARAFLDRLPAPRIVVPGNHDVPLHNVAARLLQPLRQYRRYITDDLRPYFHDEEMAVLGVNTARSLTIKEGRINDAQVAWVSERLRACPPGAVKIIVTHHPFDVPHGHDERDLVGRARMAMEALARCGVDLFLAGHLHVSHTTPSAARYNISGHSALVVQAGTVASDRRRGEENSFNVVRIDRPQIAVERFEWQPARGEFALVSSERFRHTSDGWVPLQVTGASS
jgi:3',5'-cyclic AMP phosphodiesterase CpdA